MVPTNFSYHRPSTVSEAVQLLASHGDEAKVLAGGHSLLPSMKLRLNSPDHLIDLSALSDLKNISESNGNIVIGAMCTHAQIAGNALVNQHLAMMAQTGGMIGDIQVRNMGTIGGSIAHADPAADWPASLLAAEATIVVQGSAGQRSIAATDFFQGLYETALNDGELITEIHVPIPAAGTSSAYEKFLQPASRFAIVGCAVMITQSGGTCTDVRVAFTGVSDMAFRDANVEGAMTGKAATADSIASAASQAANGVDILSDHFASEEYRKHLASVYARRALTTAVG
ncbi:MAG: xanthine dehydrogenase family protein subunit M [Bacteroidota bacterium]